MALTRIGSVGLATGIDINAGVGTFTGNLTVGGVLTYEDVTNVDSIGIITARSGVKVGSGITLSSDGDIFFTGIMTGNGSGLTGVANTDVIFTDKLSIGDGTQTGGDQINIGIGSDLTLYHSGSHSFIDRKAGGTGDIYVRLGTDNALIAKTDGAVELYHDNSKKLETASGGVTVTGTLAATAVTGDGSGLTGIGGTDFIHSEQINNSGIVTATSFVPTVGQFSHRNVFRNGGMTIHERTGNTTGINDGNNYFVADGWIYNHGSNGTVTVSHETDSPDGFSNSIKVEATSAGTSSNPAQFYQKIEGQDLQRFAKGTSSAQKFAISFYIKSKVTGNFVLDLYDSDNTRSCQQIYTVNQSQTWERKTVIIPADTTGTFDNDVNSSLQVYWKVFDGNQTGTLHTTWQAHTTNADRGVGQVNALATNGDYVQITGVQLEVGPVATPFEHRTFQDELLRNQRYYYAHKGPLWGQTSAGDHLDLALYFPVPMRSTPSFNQVDTSLTFKNRLNQGNSISANTYTISGGTNQYGAMWIARPASGESWDTADGRIYYYHAPEGTTSYEFTAEP